MVYKFLRIIKDVLSGRRVLLVSDYASANMVFLYEVALSYVKEKQGVVGIVEGLPIRVDLLEEMAKVKGLGKELSRIVVLKPGFKPTIPVLIYGADQLAYDDLVKLSAKTMFATSYKSGRLPKLLHARIARLVKVNGEYILYYGYSRIRLRILTSGVEVLESIPKGIIGKAMEELMKALTEYGPITHKDAVYVLMGSLGIDKKQAQYLLRELVIKRYIRIEGGYIIIEDYSM